MKHILYTLVFLFIASNGIAQETQEWEGKFEQLGQELPTPNLYRNADGSPGPSYWQQKADYVIDVTLDDEKQKIFGKETVTYYNNSPNTLSYLWIQLDQNRQAAGNEELSTMPLNLRDSISGWAWNYLMQEGNREAGYHIQEVSDTDKKALNYTINKTMMRIDLDQALEPGEKFTFNIQWWYNINNRMQDRRRSGYEFFPEDGNYAYSIGQFYPRMAVYDDFEGWQQKQFLGSGEFALTFGDYDVSIHVPNDHLVMATGDLQNPKKVLSKEHYKNYKKALITYDKPVIIASEEDAIEREKTKSGKYQTWKFKAENVRDFAFASSRKFIWDAQAVLLGGKRVLAQSLYPKEGNPLWEKESTKAVINTLKTYSKYSIDYPYPHATSVHAAAIGMEYPMICFNFGRPNPDRTYTDAIKYQMIGVIIHEVGHNFFPMIVNSDERQWAWMDEGLNSFLQYVTEQECYEKFPSSRGPATSIVPYMKGKKKYIRPIMTNPEQIVQLGNNAYGKPATALNILRETVMGREAFDKGFKTYSERWAFKHPKPADFFRSMEDASGVDLDWFWRGWFYTNDHVDIAIDTIISFQIEDGKSLASADQKDTSKGGPNADMEQPVHIRKKKAFKISKTPEQYYWEFRERIDDKTVSDRLEDKFIYQLEFSNKGGLVMPLIIKALYTSGEEKIVRIPAEIWKSNERKISKVLVFDKEVQEFHLDPFLETADTDTSNNSFPRKEAVSKVQAFKNNQ